MKASEVTRAAGLHRGTAYNILRPLHVEGYVGYDAATRSYSVSLHIHELAHGVLRRRGLLDLACPLMHAVSGKQVRRIMRYSGGHPAFRERCEAVAADGYRELALA